MKLTNLNLISKLGELITELADSDSERISDDFVRKFNLINANLNDEKHSVYKKIFKIEGITYVYIGYTRTEVNLRNESAVSSKAADTGLNKFLREKGINTYNINQYDNETIIIETYLLEEDARKREKEEIAKAHYDENVELLNMRCLPKE